MRIFLSSDNRSEVHDLPSFHRCGFYDWRFVTINRDGLFTALLNGKHGLSLDRIQGRVIVHPELRDEVIHEVVVDLQDAEIDRNGQLVKKGTFANITKNLAEYKKNNCVSTVYVMGALDRYLHPSIYQYILLLSLSH